MGPPNRAFFYIPIVVAAAATLLVAVFSSISWNLFPAMLLFIVLIVVASFLIVQDPSGGVVSSAITLIYVVIFVFNPATAFFVVGLGYAIGNTLPRNWVTWRASFNGAQMGLSAFLGGLAYRGLSGDLGASSIGSLIIPVLAGALVHQIANNFFIAALITEVRHVRFLRTWVNFVRELLWPNLLSIPTALLIAVLYVRVHHGFALTFLLSLPFQRWAIRLYLEKRSSYARIIEHLVRAGELSLPGTRGHPERVAMLSVSIGRQLGLAERDIEAIEYAALLHDIGMIGMDDLIDSPDASGNRQLIESHARLGAEIVSELRRPDITEMVLNHHARHQSNADATKAALSSIGARIVTLAEEVDSRLFGLFPYVEKQSFETILHFVKEGTGKAFDPQVVSAFHAVVRQDGFAGLPLANLMPAAFER